MRDPAVSSTSPAGLGALLACLAALLGCGLLLATSPEAGSGSTSAADSSPELGAAASTPEDLPPDAAAPADAAVPPVARGDGWMSLFDGNSLKGWEPTKFGGEGDVMVENGQIVMTQGNDMTGVTTTRKDLPTLNYELSFDGRRVQGNDFFCGLTFPVKDDPCSLILGGWGGGVCGLSSIDGFDASENASSSYREFERDKWYPIRLRVTQPRIEAWIGEEKIVEQDLEGRRISIRVEVELNRPLGFSTWRTTGAVRNVRIRKLTEQEIAASAKSGE